MSGNNKSGGVLLYDSLDKPNPSTPTIKRDWREDIPRYVFLSFLILLILILFLLSFQWINSYDSNVMYVGWFIIILVLIALAIVCIGSLTVFIYGMSLEARRKSLINVFEYQTNIDNMQNVLTPYFRAMEERMKHTLFAGIQNLTYSPSSVHNVPVQEEKIQEDIPIIEAELPILDDMRNNGLIGRSGNSILLGWSDDE